MQAAVSVLLIAFIVFQGASAQTAPAVAASSTATEITAYDVASIHPSKGDDHGWGIHTNDNTFAATNVTLKTLLQQAYDIREDLISGEPDWTHAARYDLQAKIVDAEPDALKKLSDLARRSLLQRLLAERFGLKVHTETKILPVYELVVAKGGQKLTETPAHTAEGTSSGISTHSSSREAELTATATTTPSFAKALGHQLQHSIIDRTGLPGTYDLKLIWAPDYGSGVSPEASAAPIFTALQEQLGLKLQASKGPVETLIVDHVEKPTEN